MAYISYILYLTILVIQIAYLNFKGAQLSTIVGFEHSKKLPLAEPVSGLALLYHSDAGNSFAVPEYDQTSERLDKSWSLDLDTKVERLIVACPQIATSKFLRSLSARPAVLHASLPVY